jgi:cation:H+ antiporter
MPEILSSALAVGAGLALLGIGGNLLVRASSALAAMLRISPLVIGLTVVAFGTSAPELAVSVQAAYAGSGELAVGNLVGSNVANVLLILGLSALVAPLAVSSQLIRFDAPLVIGASVLLLLLGLDGEIGAWEGILLSSLLVAYIHWSLRKGRAESAQSEALSKDEAISNASLRQSVVVQVFLVLSGLVLLGVGGHWLVQGAAEIARALGVQELAIGLTIIAVDTSLPELATSVLAVARGERDLWAMWSAAICSTSWAFLALPESWRRKAYPCPQRPWCWISPS